MDSWAAVQVIETMEKRTQSSEQPRTGGVEPLSTEGNGTRM